MVGRQNIGGQKRKTFCTWGFEGFEILKMTAQHCTCNIKVLKTFGRVV